MASSNERQSNFELFRIVATLLILIVHCNGWFLSQWGGVTTWAGGKGAGVGLCRAYIQSFSCIGVNCFVLLSGYFSIKPRLKSIVNLFTTLAFFYVGTYALGCLLDKWYFSWNGFLTNVLAFSRENWFIQCYLFLMLLSPILNAFVERVKGKSLLLYIGFFMLCEFYFSCVRPSRYFYFNNGYSITHFVLIYLIGRYLCLYGVERLKNLRTVWLWVAFLCLTTLMVVFRSMSLDELRWLSYSSPLLIVSSAVLLLIFSRIKCQNKVVNYIAKSSLAVYIFHTCGPIINWFAAMDVRIFQSMPYSIYLLQMGCVILGVFLVAIMLDKVRLLLCKPIFIVVNRLDSRVKQWKTSL